MINVNRLSMFDGILLILIVYGIILRIITFWTGDIVWDGALYASMGITFSQYHDFLYPWSQTQLWGYSITYPLYLAGFYSVFGSTIVVTKIAAILLSVLLLFVVYLVTKDLYDYRVGLIVTAITALDMRLIISTKTGFSENMVVLFFVLAMWAMLKGIKKDEKYIILGSLFAGLTLISKTKISIIFVLIGVMGFLVWRFIYMRWKLFRNRNYMAGLGIFLIIISIRYMLALKNGFWSIEIIFEMISDFSTFVQILLLKVFWILLLISIYAVFWMSELKNTFKIKEEYYGFLWIIIISLALMIILLTSIIPSMEAYSWHEAIFREDNLRYTVLLYIPLMWLAIGNTFNTKNKNGVRDGIKADGIKALINDKKRILITLLVLFVAGFTFIEVDDKVGVFLLFGGLSLAMKDSKKKLAMMLTVFLIMGTNATSGSVRTEIIEAAEGLNKFVKEGDIVAVDRADNPILKVSPHHIYPYLINRNITLVLYSKGSNATYILSQKDISYEGYELIQTFNYEWKPTLLRKIFMHMTGKHEVSKRLSMKLWKIRYQALTAHTSLSFT